MRHFWIRHIALLGGLQVCGYHPGRSVLLLERADDFGALLPPGESGELQLRGPMVFTHYFNAEAPTTAAFTAGGWLRSERLGRVEEGRLNVLGRCEDRVSVDGAQGEVPDFVNLATERPVYALRARFTTDSCRSSVEALSSAGHAHVRSD